MMHLPQVSRWVDSVDNQLIQYFSQKDPLTHPLDRAMEYSLLAGGKRLRPVLTLAVVDCLGGNPDSAIPLSLASELLHTYSLIHDDLPSMDNDELRRGKPTNHIVFGEALAILAGDALQSEAFRLLIDEPCTDLDLATRLAILSDFAHAVGRNGMVGGQVMDLQQAGKQFDIERLRQLHGRKTGALIHFCVRLGARLGRANAREMAAFDTYGHALGLLFQITDDILDLEAESCVLGKTAGKDQDQDKATFPKLLGLEGAKAFADETLSLGQDALTSLERDCKLLSDIAEYVRNRGH